MNAGPPAVPGLALSAVQARLFTPITVGIALVAVVCVFVRDIPMPLQYVPFAASLVLFGLPHGAMDHLVPARTLGRPVTTRTVSRVVLLYALLGTAVVVAWIIAPVEMFAFFIAMTWFHWGQGDRYALVAFDGAQYPRGTVMAALVITVRGGLPMLVPLLAHPDTYRQVLVGAAGLFDRAAANNVDVVFEPAFRFTVGTIFAIFTATYFVIACFRAHGRSDHVAWRRDLVEVLLLAVYFTAVPPVLAVGLYFCFWHAIRHIIRLALLDEPSARELRHGRFAEPFRRFAADTWPVTLAAIALLVCFAVFLPNSLSDAASALGVYLVLISALTLPHVVIVTWMDHHQRTVGPARLVADP